MKRKSFTLVELIITIAIIAVLAVTAFLVVTKWISKSRDSSRLQDISVIQQGLETEIVNTKVYPMPDNYTGIYDTGNALAWNQGEFTDNVRNQIVSLSKLPKDPQGRNYGYSLSNDKKQYQLRALLENTSYNDTYTDRVSAATQISKINGNYNGFLVTRQTYSTGNICTLWNIPTLFVWSGTGISSGTNYIQENNKISDNTTSVRFADVSSLYDADSSNNSNALDNIVSTFSGTNGVSTQALASLTMKTAAGGVYTTQSSGGTPSCGNGQSWDGSKCAILGYQDLTSGYYYIDGTVNTFGCNSDGLTDPNNKCILKVGGIYIAAGGNIAVTSYHNTTVVSAGYGSTSSSCISSPCAPSYCQGATWGGKVDWYLPTMAELSVIFNNKSKLVSLNLGLTYWSSDFRNWGNGWTDRWDAKIMTDGTDYYGRQDYGYSARCVHR